MNIDNLSSRINNGGSKWNTAPGDRCLMDDEDSDYWNDVGGVAGKIEVRQIILDDVATTFVNKVGAVCFSKRGNYYNADEELASGTPKVPDEFIFICTRTSSSSSCDVDTDTGDPNEGDIYAKKKKFLFSIGWTRFGEVSLEKWSQKMGEGDDGVPVAREGKWTPL